MEDKRLHDPPDWTPTRADNTGTVRYQGYHSQRRCNLKQICPLAIICVSPQTETSTSSVVIGSEQIRRQELFPQLQKGLEDFTLGCFFSSVDAAKGAKEASSPKMHQTHSGGGRNTK